MLPTTANAKTVCPPANISSNTFKFYYSNWTPPWRSEQSNSGGGYFSHQNNPAEKIIKNEVSVCITFLKLGLKNNLFFKCTGSVYDQEAAFLLYYLGPPQEAEKFSFEFRLSKHESQKETIVTGPSVSVADPVPARQIRCHRHSFHFTLNSFKLKTIGKLTTFSWYGKWESLKGEQTNCRNQLLDKLSKTVLGQKSQYGTKCRIFLHRMFASFFAVFGGGGEKVWGMVNELKLIFNIFA